jgi:hypothetical protein
MKTRITAVWLALICATVLSWVLGTDHGLGSASDHRAASTAIISVAFTKVRFVGLYFMELRDAPLALRGVFEGYCIVVFAAVLGMYLAS